MNKRGQGISINTIIIAVIALIVLVVLVAIFTGRLGLFSKGIQTIGDATKSCSDQGGQPYSEKCPSNFVAIASSDAATEGNVCCVDQSSSRR